MDWGVLFPLNPKIHVSKASTIIVRYFKIKRIQSIYKYIMNNDELCRFVESSPYVNVAYDKVLLIPFDLFNNNNTLLTN